LKDSEKSKEQLIAELESSRKKNVELESSQSATAKVAEEKLRISEKQSRTWLEHSPVCTKIVDLDNNLQYMSASGIEALKITDTKEIYGKQYPLDFYPEAFKSQMRSSMEQVKKTGEVVTQEASVADLDGNELWFHSTLVPVKDEKGVVEYLIIVSDEITERRMLEAQLRQAQKMQAIGVLTGGIAHEFNNLLTPILGLSELLVEDKSKSDPDREALVQIGIASQRAKELVQQLLAYGRKSLSRRKSIAIESIAQDVTELIRNTIHSNIYIKKDFEMKLPAVLAMPNEIHQVILNLCLNACDAMPEGGELTLRLRDADFHKFTNHEGLEREGHYVCLSVQDTGSGMDETTLDRIYDPFFTTKGIAHGSGLGLSVVQGIVEQHQGHIEVDTSEGEGSTFNVYFPISDRELDDTVEKVVSANRSGNENIMLIDDESLMINVGTVMLERLGYKVSGFLDCNEALKAFGEQPKAYDLVITDYGMPKLNGKQLAEKIKEIRSDIPVILCTGYGDLVTREDIGVWGMDDLLIKPFKLKELSLAVRGTLDHKILEN
jgi:PAS domain S-box-containing protein